MLLSDVAVKRPVFAAVISLLLVAFGLLSAMQLPLRELPDIDPPIVSIETGYPGASAAVVETRITQLIEDQVSGIEGIKTIDSVSRNGRSDITIEFTLDRDVDDAANDVRDGVSRVIDQLPDEADPPEITKVDADADVIVWYNLSSSRMNLLELTDYADRYIVDRLAVIDGVARVRIGGAQRYAMRIWLDRNALAARQLTVLDIEEALESENVELPAGRVESTSRDLTVRVNRAYRTAADFANLVIAQGEDGHLIRLGEVARVETGPEEERASFKGNGEPMIGLGIIKQSTANTLDVARATRAEILRIRPTLPAGTELHFSYDTSVFIEAAIHEVYFTLAIATGLVLLVIYLFLGSVRAALIPAVTVPVSLIACFTVLHALGFSINLLTLLALVLAIGLVVDDAIVMLENIQRRIDLGEPPLVAAYRGARQVSFAVIATTLVLVAVFVPLAFMGGNIGRLFTELAFAIAGAVSFSSLVALTLAPVLCSKLLRRVERQGRLSRLLDGGFRRLTRSYRESLERCIRRPAWVGAGLVVLIIGIVWLLQQIPEELAPAEDRGAFFVMMNGPEGAGFDYSLRQMNQLEAIMLPLAESGEAQRVLVRVPRGFGNSEEMHTGIGIVVMDHWDNRDRSTEAVMNELRQKFAAVPGVQAFPVMRQGLGQGTRKPVQFVIGGSSYEEIARWRDVVLAAAGKNPNLLGVDADYKETRPHLYVAIDRNRAADLGVSLQTIGRTLETLLGSRQVTTYIDQGEEYDVILQGQRTDRQEPGDISNIYVRSEQGSELIPLSNLVTLSEGAESGALNRFNRLRAVTIEANLAPGYTLGEALDFLENVVAQELAGEGARIDYKGQARELRDASNTLYFTFGLALLMVFLVLAAQFESFIHPLVIILTVPLAVGGALLGLFLIDGTLNIYSQIGIVILIGLAAKNGILIVEFANQLRDQRYTLRQALLEAATTRLRPILMTGLSTAMGALPLVVASGAGSASRTAIGIVVFSGVLFATLLTLYVVPTFYLLLGRYTRSPETLARELARWENPAEKQVSVIEN